MEGWLISNIFYYFCSNVSKHHKTYIDCEKNAYQYSAG